MSGVHSIVASLVPSSLIGRRAIACHDLYPTPKYPCAGINVNELTSKLMNAMKESPSDSDAHLMKWQQHQQNQHLANDGRDGNVDEN